MDQRHEAGTADVESHPGNGGIDAWYDELEVLLAPQRQVPVDEQRPVAEWRFDDGSARRRRTEAGRRRSPRG
ncbi:hypothetical protein [Streptomyces cacaoi]|uniref:hypothetical protein n=1 Tax=Streptomyces cacaoi TaxID=1898 RepID=UPI0037480582